MLMLHSIAGWELKYWWREMETGQVTRLQLWPQSFSKRMKNGWMCQLYVCTAISPILKGTIPSCNCMIGTDERLSGSQHLVWTDVSCEWLDDPCHSVSSHVPTWASQQFHKSLHWGAINDYGIFMPLVMALETLLIPSRQWRSKWGWIW